jgi:IS1 family transposase/transposase-like protein
MIVAVCEHGNSVRCGKDRKGNQRMKCNECGKYFLAPVAKPIGNMRIGLKQAAFALNLLLEGMSIRATERLTGLHRDTVDDLILTVGANCERLLEAKIVDVPVNQVQVDEIWEFVLCKEKVRVNRGHAPQETGDCWTFTGIERNTKLLLAYHTGLRDSETCNAFLQKLERATSGRFQISTDGLNAYTNNVPYTFGNRVDFAQLVKTYAAQLEVTRYSPATIISAEKRPIFGEPDFDMISTSHVERMNLTIRMHSRRFTRLTNAHSKSLAHHVAMQAIFFAFYNFCRKHETLKGQTPAMASGLADKVWSMGELLTHAAGV